MLAEMTTLTIPDQSILHPLFQYSVYSILSWGLPHLSSLGLNDYYKKIKPPALIEKCLTEQGISISDGCCTEFNI